MKNHSVHCRLIFGLASFWLAVLFIQCGSNSPGSQAPEYSLLFDRILELEEAGEYGDALRLFPEIYGKDIPVTAFYETLDRKKREILKAIIRKGSVQVEGEDIGLDLLQHVFFQKLESVDYLNFDIRIEGELPAERFFYFSLVHGSRGLKSALQSDDPWIVAAALFSARKGGQTGLAQTGIDRWERRPDLWDDVCSDMALLYLAGLPADDLENLTITHSDIRAEIKKLKSLSSDACFAHLAYFHRFPISEDFSLIDFGSRPVTLIRFRRGEKQETKRYAGDPQTYYNYEELDRTELDPGDFKERIIELEPGFYKFKYLAGGASERGMAAVTYGDSALFECRPERIARVFLGLTGGI
jgi:hypothetical protein